MKRALAAFGAVLVVAGCGGGEAAPTDTTTSPAALTAPVRVYWLRDGKVWPAAREVETPGVASAVLAELLAGPTEQEEAELQFVTAIPTGTVIDALSIEDGVATVDLSAELDGEAWAQVVYTLTQFPAVRSVDLAEGDYVLFTRSGRDDLEDLTPAILVESPLSFEDVSSPVRATGTANTFEANFSYELTDTDGRIVDENFVTATSGTGTRGTFDFTTVTFTVPFAGVGSLIVFEHSAKDGSRINLVEIPLRMTE